MVARGPVGGAGRHANLHRKRREERQRSLNESAGQGHEEARNPSAPRGAPDPDLRRLMLGRPDRGLRNGTIAIGIHTMGTDPRPNFGKVEGRTWFAAPNGRTYTWTTKHPSHPASAEDAFYQLSELGERLY